MTYDRSMVFSGPSGFLHQWNLPPRINWNIVESGVEHYQTNKQTDNQICFGQKTFNMLSNNNIFTSASITSIDYLYFIVTS